MFNAIFSSFKIKFGLGAVGLTLGYFFGGWDHGIEYLLLAVTLDYIFGIMSAIYNKKYSYDTAWRGVLKKVGFFGIVAVSVLLERTLGKPELIHPYVTFYLIGNECFSLLKSFKEMGLPIPDIFEKEINSLVDKYKGGGSIEG